MIWNNSNHVFDHNFAIWAELRVGAVHPSYVWCHLGLEESLPRWRTHQTGKVHALCWLGAQWWWLASISLLVGLSVSCLGFLTAWCLDSKREAIETVTSLKGWVQNWNSITSMVFYWLKPLQTQLRFKATEKETPSFSGRSDKNVVTICHYIFLVIQHFQFHFNFVFMLSYKIILNLIVLSTRP